MDVDPKTIQTIMRHSNIKTTLNIYVKAVDETRRDAMDLLGQISQLATNQQRLEILW
jgi:hypothetical protein